MKITIDKKAERKMKRFIRSLGIKIACMNNELSVVNNRPIFNIREPQVAIKQMRAALACVSHKYFIVTDSLIGVQRHCFRLDGLGSMELEVNPIYPKLPKPLWVRPQTSL